MRELCWLAVVGIVSTSWALYAYSQGREDGKDRGYKDGYSKGWSDCECWWIEQDAETQKAREAMWRKL